MEAIASYRVDSRPLVRAPEIFCFTYDDLGRDAVTLMNERFRGNRYLELDTSLLVRNHPVGHINIFRRYAIGDIIRELTGWNVRPITPAESEIALREGTLPETPTKYFEDLGVLIHDAGEMNEKYAEYLMEQAQKRGIRIRFPAIATSLSTMWDKDFEYCIVASTGVLDNFLS